MFKKSFCGRYTLFFKTKMQVFSDYWILVQPNIVIQHGANINGKSLLMSDSINHPVLSCQVTKLISCVWGHSIVSIVYKVNFIKLAYQLYIGHAVVAYTDGQVLNLTAGEMQNL